MTISSETFRFRYTSTGGTTYPYTNKILDEDDLAVYVDDVLQTIDTHYTVTGVGESGGGNVVFLSAPTAGSDVLITKDGVTMTQDTDYTENDSFPASAHENALDKLTNLIQKIWDYTRRSVKVAITSTLTDIELPEPSARDLIGWNSGATNLANYSLTDISYLAATDIGVSVVTADDATAVRTAIDALGTSKISDAAYGSGWNGVTDAAPSKNAVYDKIETIISSKIVQVVEASTVTSGSTATAIPMDDTTPQNTEGAEVLTATITPTNAANRLRIDAFIPTVDASTNATVSAALFQDSNANALSASTVVIPSSGNGLPLFVKHEMAAGAAVSTTFKLRLGPNTGTGYWLRRAGGTIFNSTVRASLTVTEVTS